MQFSKLIMYCMLFSCIEIMNVSATDKEILVYSANIIEINEVRFQIKNIDSPSLFDPKCRFEREPAKEARKRLADLLLPGETKIFVIDEPTEGVIPIRIEVKGMDIASTLIDEGFAKPNNEIVNSWCK